MSSLQLQRETRNGPDWSNQLYEYLKEPATERAGVQQVFSSSSLWKNSEALTFGAHWKCIPGTGRVVTYIVIQRYRYKVPMIKKNLRPTIDLKEEQG